MTGINEALFKAIDFPRYTCGLLSCCMLISVVMGAEAAKSHRKSQGVQAMLILTRKIKPQLASGEAALQDQYLRSQTANRYLE